jgi:glycosyltransferase involved in cell wall biosynthesis
MMEAISFGIPILSTAINGTPEIVTPETGVLVSISDSVEIIAEEIEHILKDNSFNQEKIKTFFFNNFNAENNYSKFAKEIAK